MTDIIPEIETRRARRGFLGKTINEDILIRLFEAASKAPSCANRQPWRFLVASSEEALGKVRATLSVGNYWAKTAPVLVVIATRNDLDCQLDFARNYAQFDTGMATMNLMLQATREGLYAHPMAGFDVAKLRALFTVEEGTDIITLLAIGYPGDGSNLNEKHALSEQDKQKRVSLKDIVQWNSWLAVAPRGSLD